LQKLLLLGIRRVIPIVILEIIVVVADILHAVSRHRVWLSRVREEGGGKGVCDLGGEAERRRGGG
jgi:hypothetical protein